MIIFIYGQDTYRSRQKLNDIIDKYKSRHKSGLNFSKLYAPEVGDFLDFKKRIESLSMFDEKRFLVVEEVFKSDWIEQWHEYLLNKPSLAESQGEIILFYEKDKINQKDKFFSLLRKEPIMHEEFALLEGTQLARWVSKEMAIRNINLSPVLVKKLILSIGNDLWQFSGELDKIMLSGAVEEKEIDLLVSDNFSLNIFEAMDALAEKNKGKAIRLLNMHLEKGEVELKLLANIAYQLRNLIKIRELIEKEMPHFKIKELVKMHPFVFQKTLFQAKKFSFEDLKRLYDYLAKADINIKTGKVSPRTALESLVFEF